MKKFFSSLEAIQRVLADLSNLVCPRCGARVFGRHGYIRGFVAPNEYGIRAFRICCLRRRGGCGHAPSIRLDTALFYRCYSTGTVSLFLQALLEGRSVKAAWEACGIRLSLDVAYALLRRMRLILPTLRTRLWNLENQNRGPPPNVSERTADPLLETLERLWSIFGPQNTVQKYHHHIQRPFLEA